MPDHSSWFHDRLIYQMHYLAWTCRLQNTKRLVWGILELLQLDLKVNHGNRYRWFLGKSNLGGGHPGLLDTLSELISLQGDEGPVGADESDTCSRFTGGADGTREGNTPAGGLEQR